jgi:hypothetical protein
MTTDEKMKVAENVVALLNSVRRLEQLCGLAPLTEKEEDDRDAMFLHAALLKAQEDGPAD